MADPAPTPNGILAVWSDITPEAEDDYTAWYEREHMFERLTLPGFRRARHYLTVTGAPKYFTYFELESPDVVASAAYLAQADAPSPWTQRVLPHFRKANRTAFEVVRRRGRGFGAGALTMRFDATGAGTDDVVARLLDDLLVDIVARPGIVAAQLWKKDAAATGQPTRDRALRADGDRVSDLAVFIEGTTCAVLESLARECLAPLALASSPDLAIHRLLNGAEADEAPPL